MILFRLKKLDGDETILNTKLIEEVQGFEDFSIITMASGNEHHVNLPVDKVLAILYPDLIDESRQLDDTPPGKKELVN